MNGKRKALTAAAIAAVLSVGTAHAANQPRWDRYRSTHPSTSQVDRVVIRAECINEEDSASHLRLREYGSGVAVYGCSHKGY